MVPCMPPRQRLTPPKLNITRNTQFMGNVSNHTSPCQQPADMNGGDSLSPQSMISQALGLDASVSGGSAALCRFETDQRLKRQAQARASKGAEQQNGSARVRGYNESKIGRGDYRHQALVGGNGHNTRQAIRQREQERLQDIRERFASAHPTQDSSTATPPQRGMSRQEFNARPQVRRPYGK